MSIISFGGQASKMTALIGIRARLIVLALILVAPLMMDRVRLLEEGRAKQAAAASAELSELAQHSADAQKEILATVQAVLKASAYIYNTTPDDQEGCAVLRGSLSLDMPWIRSLAVIGPDGKMRCSTISTAKIGIDLSDRDYFQKALGRREMVVSDYIFSRATDTPTIVVAYPAFSTRGIPAIIAASIDLQWMSKFISRRNETAGVTATLIDSNGLVLATRSEDSAMIGKPLRDSALLKALEGVTQSTRPSAPIIFTAEDGDTRAATVASVEGTNARMVVSVNEDSILTGIDRSIRNAYIQLAIVILLALGGAWIVGERLIIHPIGVMIGAAQRFGNGDLSPMQAGPEMPREFLPLMKAFNRMAGRLRERERELVATNDRLTVMASVDPVSGLANRRGFQSRLEFEWVRAEQNANSIALIMIDVDHFKLFNDTYGHLEGDACLAQVGAALLALSHQGDAFAARYGGEEFCLLLPNANAVTAMEIGEQARAAVEALGIAHSMSTFQCVTASAGVASVIPGQNQTMQDLIEAADAALYAAKRRGRNNVASHALIRADDQAMSLAS